MFLGDVGCLRRFPFTSPDYHLSRYFPVSFASRAGVALYTITPYGDVESNNVGREIDKERYLGWLVLVDEQCQRSRASALIENGISRKSTISEES